MRERIADKLKTSLESERKSVKEKVSDSLEERFTKADSAFETSRKTKVDKINIIKDTFTLPEKDYKLIEDCRSKLLLNRISATKSEVIRAGLIILNKLSDNELVESIKLVEKIKTGRRKNN